MIGFFFANKVYIKIIQKLQASIEELKIKNTDINSIEKSLKMLKK